MCTGLLYVHWTVICALDCYVCTGLLYVHWTVICALDCYMCTGWLYVHWIVTCALNCYMCTGLLYVQWIYVPKYRDQWRTVVKRVMNIQVPHEVECSSKKWVIFRP
jgi:hypothetical protein